MKKVNKVTNKNRDLFVRMGMEQNKGRKSEN